MVSQIPALLMAISSGLVITRITHEHSSDLGRDISTQITAAPLPLQVASLVLLGFALIPGFPTLTFLVLSAGFGLLGFLGWRRNQAAAEDVPDEAPLAASGKRDHDLLMLPMAPVNLLVGSELYDGLDRTAFKQSALEERVRWFDEMGVPFPPLQLRLDPTAPGDRWQLLIEGVPVSEGTLPAGALRLMDDPAAAGILGIDLQEFALSSTEEKTYWAAAQHSAALTRAGIGFLPPDLALARLAVARLPKHSAEFLGIEEVSRLMSAMENKYESLVSEAQKALPAQKIAGILRRLVEEEIPIRSLRVVLETIVEWAAREKDADVLAEYVRCALARQISHKFADTDRFIPSYVVEADIEDMIRSSVRQSPAGVFVALEAQQARSIVDHFKKAVGDLSAHRSTPVFLASMETRRYLRRFLLTHDIDLPVLSHKEVANGYKVHPLAMLSLK
ncbi:Low calcium response locus protein D [Nymphon striatum]|nr:Low calcium response locus protein D [Nymphon striatum]